VYRLRLTPTGTNRRRLTRAVGALLALRTLPALVPPLAITGYAQRADALMAGLPPDSPAARVDPNSLESPWAGVVAVVVGGGTYSGVVVHRRFVLTAAHVAAGHAGSDVRVQVNAGEASRVLAAAAVHVHPRYAGFTKPFAFWDAALIELAEPVPEAVPVPERYTGPLLPGTELTFVGYGASGFGDQGANVPPDPAVKRTGRNRAERFVALDDIPLLFLYDFDGPGPDTNAMGSPTLGNAVETSAAGGDSGAPVFIVRGNYRALAGLLTFVADLNNPGVRHSTFGASGGGVLLGPLREWLDGVVGR